MNKIVHFCPLCIGHTVPLPIPSNYRELKQCLLLVNLINQASCRQEMKQFALLFFPRAASETAHAGLKVRSNHPKFTNYSRENTQTYLLTTESADINIEEMEKKSSRSVYILPVQSSEAEEKEQIFSQIMSQKLIKRSVILFSPSTQSKSYKKQWKMLSIFLFS